MSSRAALTAFLAAVLASAACTRPEVFSLNVARPEDTATLVVTVTADGVDEKQMTFSRADGDQLPTQIGIELRRSVSNLAVMVVAYDDRGCTQRTEASVVTNGRINQASITFPKQEWAMCPGDDGGPEASTDGDLPGDRFDAGEEVAIDARDGGADRDICSAPRNATTAPARDASDPCLTYCANYISSCDYTLYFHDEDDCLFKCERFHWDSADAGFADNTITCRIAHIPKDCQAASPMGTALPGTPVCGSACTNYCYLRSQLCNDDFADCMSKSCSPGSIDACVVQAAVWAAVSPADWCPVARDPPGCRRCP
jgi:hypothetical protein